ncbi:MAG: YgaP family membrane protein [Burkholderiaceae bacterium]
MWFTVFVGANLFLSGFTHFCPLEIILRKMGVKPAHA